MIKLGGSACLVAMVLAFALGQETGEPEAVIHARNLKNSEVVLKQIEEKHAAADFSKAH